MVDVAAVGVAAAAAAVAGYNGNHCLERYERIHYKHLTYWYDYVGGN